MSEIVKNYLNPLSLIGRTVGSGLMTEAGLVVAAIYIIPSEVARAASGQPPHSLLEIGTNYAAIVGSFAATGRVAGSYFSNKFWKMISSYTGRRS